MLASGAPVDAIDSEGQTPLMRACEQGETECAHVLLAAGADVRLRDDTGAAALDHARDAHHYACVAELEAHMGRLERQRLVAIGIALRQMDLPVLLLVEIYAQAVEFPKQRIPLFACWEILKTIKQF
eukprot:TRINITY_DN5806_c0_g1_i3.p3 TRINITY_DN5806_c0_g1~~TRINITY_DN5806_c0_g1_i3.p3  ORF type:complete len:127 (-),score=68.96 TRINITY_DN5806_c0_g1_i3:54-434(-)